MHEGYFDRVTRVWLAGYDPEYLFRGIGGHVKSRTVAARLGVLCVACALLGLSAGCKPPRLGKTPQPAPSKTSAEKPADDGSLKPKTAIEAWSKDGYLGSMGFSADGDLVYTTYPAALKSADGTPVWEGAPLPGGDARNFCNGSGIYSAIITDMRTAGDSKAPRVLELSRSYPSPAENMIKAEVYPNPIVDSSADGKYFYVIDAPSVVDPTDVRLRTWDLSTGSQVNSTTFSGYHFPSAELKLRPVLALGSPVTDTSWMEDGGFPAAGVFVRCTPDGRVEVERPWGERADDTQTRAALMDFDVSIRSSGAIWKRSM